MRRDLHHFDSSNRLYMDGDNDRLALYSDHDVDEWAEEQDAEETMVDRTLTLTTKSCANTPSPSFCGTPASTHRTRSHTLPTLGCDNRYFCWKEGELESCKRHFSH